MNEKNGSSANSATDAHKEDNTPRRDVLVASHCILNPVTRVKGLGYNKKTAQKLLKTSQNIIQLPCPELLYFGNKRWEVTQDQLDIPNYRRFCRKLARSYADTIVILHKQGLTIHIAGISKSPSCAVNVTTIGYRGGLIKNAHSEHKHVMGSGIFTQELLKLLVEMGIDIETEIKCEDVSI